MRKQCRVPLSSGVQTLPHSISGTCLTRRKRGAAPAFPSAMSRMMRKQRRIHPGRRGRSEGRNSGGWDGRRGGEREEEGQDGRREGMEGEKRMREEWKEEIRELREGLKE